MTRRWLHGSAPAVMLTTALPALLGTAPAASDVTATITGLRSSRGQVLACLTARPADFPDCAKDPQARARKVPAGATILVDFGPVPQGRYAIAIVHDENGNGRLDKRLMLPREGYGFSNDAPVRFGPPSFASAAFAVGSGCAHETIRMRYMF